jgi:hypothetical protein
MEKDVEGCRRGLMSEYYRRVWLGRLRKIMKNLSQYTVRIKVSHHNKIKQDRHYCVYIRFIISVIRNMFRLLLSHLQAFCIANQASVVVATITDANPVYSH